MNRNQARENIKAGYAFEIRGRTNVRVFRSNGIRSKYPAGTYVIRYADREDTTRNFREAYHIAYTESRGNYISIGSSVGVW